MNFTLKIWRQQNAQVPGKIVEYKVTDISPEMSFLEMLDSLNQKLIEKGESVVVFDHDCREGICGQCGIFINGRAHGPVPNITTCQLHMRHFCDGDTIYIEPWRANAFPIIKDLMVNRNAFDRIIDAGGYISVSTGTAPEANAIPISKEKAEKAFDAAACIGCGACVAACKNSSAMLFVSAKVVHLNSLPQGKVEAEKRVVMMTEQMDQEGFGSCTNTLACEVECPKKISAFNITKMNWEYIKSVFMSEK